MKTAACLAADLNALCTLAAPFAQMKPQQAKPSNNFGTPGQNASFDYVVGGG